MDAFEKAMHKSQLKDSMVKNMRDQLYATHDKFKNDKRLAERSRTYELNRTLMKIDLLKEIAKQMKVEITITGRGESDD